MALRRTAAYVAAAAVYETFPGVSLLGGDAISTGFFYDFYFPHLLHPELLPQIEEKMRQIMRERREIRTMEMVPVSAKEFLKAQGHAYRGAKEELVTLVQMGSFVDQGGPAASNSAVCACFKLFSCQNLGDGRLRITGTVHPTKEALKSFLKAWSTYGHKRHETRGLELGLWKQIAGEWVWLPPGLTRRAELLSFFKKNLGEGSVEIASSGKHYQELLRETPRLLEVRERSAPSFWGEEGLLSLEGGLELKILTSLENINSSLQSIEKTFNILTFRYSLSLEGKGGKGSRSFEVEDLLGRAWKVATLKAKELVEISIPIERNLALLLELCT